MGMEYITVPFVGAEFPIGIYVGVAYDFLSLSSIHVCVLVLVLAFDIVYACGKVSLEVAVVDDFLEHSR